MHAEIPGSARYAPFKTKKNGAALSLHLCGFPFYGDGGSCDSTWRISSTAELDPPLTKREKFDAAPLPHTQPLDAPNYTYIYMGKLEKKGDGEQKK